MNRKERRAAEKAAKGGASPGLHLSPESVRLLAAATQAHEAGRLAEAEAACRQILVRDPGSIRALHLLGIMGLQTSHLDAAAAAFARALAVNDRVPELHYNLAFALEGLGKPAEAAEHYRRTVALKPDFVEAHVNLGNLMVDRGAFDDAVACYRRALELNPSSIAIRHNLGNALARQHRYGEAVEQYERVLALDPRHAPTHNNLAIARMEEGDADAALVHHRRALELDPKLAQAHVGIGNVLRARGEIAAAAEEFRQAIAVNPDYAEAHNNLGSALVALGDTAAAETCYRRALATTPPFGPALVNLGRLLLARGDVAEALALARRAVEQAPTAEARTLFAHAARGTTFTADDGGFRTLMVRALEEAWGRPAELAGAAVSLLLLDPTLATAVARARTAWPRRLSVDELLGPDGLAPVSGDAMLRALIETVPVPDIGLEHLLTSLRAALLTRAIRAGASGVVSGELTFAGALARQCFINEYVFAVTDGEQAEAEQLATTAQAGRPMTPLCVAMLACYRPLHTIAPDTWLAQRWPEPVAAVLTQQIAEPREEAALRTTIPGLTAIDDRVSLAVKEQYEDNPYPRWVAAAPAAMPAPIDDYLRERFPRVPFRPLGKTALDLLIAGCGTGQHAIETTRQLRGAHTLAVDLSRASLAYAARKTRALGIEQIDYAEADILRLDTVGRSFDVIEASGVLHHLADPLAAWRRLLDLLRPGGVMNVGLYSELGRGPIVRARGFIAERGFAPSAEGIRACRQEMMASDDPLLREAMQSGDFFSLSGCRDLLFHVQEHRLRLPQIAAFIAENGLAFLGFETSAAVRHAYAARCPDDATMTDLDTWDVFESENPRAFAAMYQFWVQKP